MLDHFSVHEVVDMTPQCNAVRYFDILVLYNTLRIVNTFYSVALRDNTFSVSICKLEKFVVNTVCHFISHAQYSINNFD